jgi:SAM-dependent methyltransferase
MADGAVCDVGCGYGEFINNIQAGQKWAIDLNENSSKHLKAGIRFIHQDCSAPWPIPENSLDVAFTSNFFEHLAHKELLNATLRQIHRCLKPGGRLIAMGPNIKYLHGQYWDFYDHHIYLTETSLGEALELEGFSLDVLIARFLPYTLVRAPEYPMFFVRLYLAMPFLWRLRGRQFLVVARKP